MVAEPRFSRQKVQKPVLTKKGTVLVSRKKGKEGSRKQKRVFDVAALPEADTRLYTSSDEAETMLLNAAEPATEHGVTFQEGHTELLVSPEADTEGGFIYPEAQTEPVLKEDAAVIADLEQDTLESVPDLVEVELTGDIDDIVPVAPTRSSARPAGPKAAAPTRSRLFTRPTEIDGIYLSPEGDTGIAPMPEIPSYEAAQEPAQVEVEYVEDEPTPQLSPDTAAAQQPLYSPFTRDKRWEIENPEQVEIIDDTGYEPAGYVESPTLVPVDEPEAGEPKVDEPEVDDSLDITPLGYLPGPVKQAPPVAERLIVPVESEEIDDLDDMLPLPDFDIQPPWPHLREQWLDEEEDHETSAEGKPFAAAISMLASRTGSRFRELWGRRWSRTDTLAVLAGIAVSAFALDRITDDTQPEFPDNAIEESISDEAAGAVELVATELADEQPQMNAAEVLTIPQEVLAARAFTGDYEAFAQSFEAGVFHMHAVPEQVAASIQSNPESWGVSAEATPEQLERMIEVAQHRVVEAISFIAGENITTFPHEMAQADSFDATVYFESPNQIKALQTWFSINKERITDSSASSMANADPFIQRHEQKGAKGEKVVELATVIDAHMPWGFAKFNSGYRSNRDQIMVIHQIADSVGLDTTDMTTEEVRQVLVQDYKKDIAPVGGSEHRHGNAIDVSLIRGSDSGYKNLFGTAFSEYGKQLVDDHVEIADVRVEPHNGWSGVLHFEYSGEKGDATVDIDDHDSAPDTGPGFEATL